MTTLIAARDLATGYAGRPVLEGITFSLPAGRRLALLGPNGGGKSTLLRALLGELPALRGSVTLGARAASLAQSDRSRLDYPVTALDVALMGTLSWLPWWRRPGRRERDRAREALGAVGLAEHADELFGALSGGQRQRALIARALAQDARILLLDEPYAGLDVPAGERLTALVDGLAAEGRAIVVATHDLEHARGLDLVLCVNRRQVALGPPAEALTPTVLATTYGGELVELPGGALAATDDCAPQR